MCYFVKVFDNEKKFKRSHEYLSIKDAIEFMILMKNHDRKLYLIMTEVTHHKNGYLQETMVAYDYEEGILWKRL